MADSIQFDYSLRELTTLLVKDQGIHEGRWMVAFEFGFAAMNAGPIPSEIRPAAIVQINKAMLVRAPDGFPADSPLVVDASQVNPGPEARKTTARTKRPAPTKKARPAKTSVAKK